MATNNFKLLEEEMETKFDSASEAIKKNINSRKDLWSLIGDLFELYIPRIVSTLFGSNISFGNKSPDKDSIQKDS